MPPDQWEIAFFLLAWFVSLVIIFAVGFWQGEDYDDKRKGKRE